MSPALDHVRQNRQVIALGALAKSSSFVGQSFWITAFVDPLIGATGLSRAGLSLAYSSATVVSALFASRLGRLADHRGVVAAWLVAGTGAVVGSTALALSTGFVAVALSIAVLRASGQGGMPLVGVLTVLRGMPEPRGVAMSITNGSLTLTAVAMPLLAALGLAVIGWRETLVAGGVVVLGATVVGVALARRHDTLRSGTGGQAHLGLPPREALPEPLDREVPVDDTPRSTQRRRPPLGVRGWLLLYMLGIGPMTITAVVFHAFELGRLSGVGGGLVAAALSGMSLVGLAGGFVAGPLYDQRGLRPLLIALTSLLTAAPLVLIVAEPGAFLTGFALLGAAAGVSGVAGSVAWSATYGEAQIGALQGLGAGGVIVGAAIGPLVPGTMHALDAPAWASPAFMAAAGALGVAAALAWRPSWQVRPAAG